MSASTMEGTVLVDGEPALVVDATVAALRGRGITAQTRGVGAPGAPAARLLVLLVPAGEEAAWRAARMAAASRVPWVAIVDGRSRATQDALVEAGAAWVLPAEAGLDAVVTAISQVGRRPSGPTGSPATPADTTTVGARLASLSQGERAVLDAMADGRSVAETALLLGQSPTTVRAHRRAVRTKLGVRSPLAAVSLLFHHQDADHRDAWGAPGSTVPSSSLPPVTRRSAERHEPRPGALPNLA